MQASSSSSSSSSPHSAWSWPTPAAPTTHFLHSTVSLANIGDAAGRQKWRPVSPTSTASTTSSASRSTTPTNLTAGTTPHALTNNPWANSMLNLSVNLSPASPTTPPSESRCATPVPVAPLAIRPNAAIVAITTSVANNNGETRPSARISPTTATAFADLPRPPPTPNPYKQAQAAAAAPLLPANIISPSLVGFMRRSIPNILIRLNWENAKAQRFYCWAMSNPKTVLLFWICEDLAAWPYALFFGLEDNMLPFEERDLQGIASDPRKIVENQWRVLLKELPRMGQHAEFQPKEVVPLQPAGTLRTTTQSKIVERVRWIPDEDGRAYVRKQFVTSRQSQKSTLSKQLQQFKRLDHTHIAKIVCTYTYGSTFAVITNAAEHSLYDYLQVPAEASRQQEMMAWIFDLANALAYLHSNEMHHGCLRPRKILVDGNRIMFSAFGFFNSTIGSSRDSEPALSEEEAYIHAAPELIAHRKVGRAGDVFSLGCILLTILSVIKGHTMATFQKYRSSSSHDPSFHANLNNVASWTARLQSLKNPAGQRREQVVAELNLFYLIDSMLVADASKRIKMKKLVKYMAEWNESRLLTRRRSFDRIDAVDAGKWASDLGQLNSYYTGR